MKIQLKSNFVVPGLENKDSVESNRSKMTLREFLEELSTLSPDPLKYVEPGTDRLNPDDWEADINGIPYQKHARGLETLIRDGDAVTLRILAQGGG